MQAARIHHRLSVPGLQRFALRSDSGSTQFWGFDGVFNKSCCTDRCARPIALFDDPTLRGVSMLRSKRLRPRLNSVSGCRTLT